MDTKQELLVVPVGVGSPENLSLSLQLQHGRTVFLQIPQFFWFFQTKAVKAEPVMLQSNQGHAAR